MTNEKWRMMANDGKRRAERVVGIFLAAMFLLLVWNSVLAKLMMLLLAVTGCVIVLGPLRRSLSKEGVIIFALTFLLVVAAVSFNLIYFR
jgi:uncharacterized membrane protein YdfJ with MMPL/SSD domain